MPHKVKILRISKDAKNVKKFAVEKPSAGYTFIPGQATLIAIDRNGWRHRQRPFTFTSLNSCPYLEFIIKIYKNNKGVTNELDKAKAGDFLLIREPFGSINYAGRGVFIAGGAGITPFIAILRQLKKDRNLDDNKLIFSNKTEEDIILKNELKDMFKNKKKSLVLTLTEENKKGCFYGRINKTFLQKHISDFSQKFYICGPELFVIGIIGFLKQLRAEKSNIIIERDF